MHPFGLEPGQQPQGLGVALEAADVGGDVVQGSLAVVPEWRVAQIVCQARGVDHVCIAPQSGAELAADLGDLK